MSATSPQIHTSTAIPHSSRSPRDATPKLPRPGCGSQGKTLWNAPPGPPLRRSVSWGQSSRFADENGHGEICRAIPTRLPGRQEPMLRSTPGGADRPGRPRLDQTAPMKRVARSPVRR